MTNGFQFIGDAGEGLSDDRPEQIYVGFDSGKLSSYIYILFFSIIFDFVKNRSQDIAKPSHYQIFGLLSVILQFGLQGIGQSLVDLSELSAQLVGRFSHGLGGADLPYEGYVRILIRLLLRLEKGDFA